MRTTTTTQWTTATATAVRTLRPPIFSPCASHRFVRCGAAHVPTLAAACFTRASHLVLTWLSRARWLPAEVKVDGPKRGKKKKQKKRDIWSAASKCKSLQEIIDEGDYDNYPSWVPNYSSIAAAPSRYPPRRFCSVTGLSGKYKCPVTGDYLATLDAYSTHRETRLKGAPPRRPIEPLTVTLFSGGRRCSRAALASGVTRAGLI